MITKKSFIIIISLFFILSTHAAIHYVKQESVGNGDGSSWANASNDLQAMIDASANSDKIFVATGVYTPAQGTSFTLGGKVLSIYGGFVGNETSTTPPAVPDTTNNKTIFQGNGNRVFYAYYKATAGDGKVDDNLTIQGCRIQGGTVDAQGGGLYMKNGTINYCTIVGNSSTNNHGGGLFFEKCTINNSIISNNYAYINGGGLYSYITLTINNTEVSHNVAEGKGGGIFSNNVAKIDNVRAEYNHAFATGGGGGIHALGSTDPSTIQNCIINNNISDGQAGGIFIGKKTKLINSEIKSNTAVYNGGGLRADSENKAEIYNCVIMDNEVSDGAGGGVDLNKSTMANCLIANNKCSQSGGGARVVGSSSATGLKAYFYNNTVANNIATSGGGVNGNKNGLVRNSIIWNNTVNGNPNDVAGETDIANSLWSEASATDGNLNTSPLFVDAESGNFQLGSLSPAINAGMSITGLPTGQSVQTTDLNGKTRIVGSVIDLGAYEYVPSTAVDFVRGNSDEIWSSGKILFVKSDKVNTLFIYSISGKLYQLQTINVGLTSLSNLTAGLYFVRVDNQVSKIVIK